MVSLSQAKTFGGIGAILMLVGGFANIGTGFGGIISLVGLILVYLGVKEISGYLNNPQIKSDFVMSIVLSIIATVALIVGMVAVLASMFSINPTDPFGDIGDSLAICVVVIIVFILFYILSAIYFKKCFDAIGQGTNIKYFNTAGLLYLIGALTLIIVVGAIIMIIAEIFLIIAFFSLPDQLGPAGQPGMPGQTGSVCPNCGRPIPMDAQVCPYCGKDFRNL